MGCGGQLGAQAAPTARRIALDDGGTQGLLPRNSEALAAAAAGKEQAKKIEAGSSGETGSTAGRQASPRYRSGATRRAQASEIGAPRADLVGKQERHA